MDKIIKYFSSNSQETSKQLSMFSLSVDQIKENMPSVISSDSSLNQFLNQYEKSQEQVTNLFQYDWDTLRAKITADNADMISRNSKEEKESTERYCKLVKECFENLSKTATSIKQLKEYFGITKHKLNDIQIEFGQRIKSIKVKIYTFKQNVDDCGDYEAQLKLEYEIRLEINRLYNLKHSHESEYAGLDKRLEELEAFNTSTELLQSLLNYQLIKFFEKSEDSILAQIKDSSTIRLANILSTDVSKWRIEQGGEGSEQIEAFYQITLSTPIPDDQFKSFITNSLLSGDQI